VLKLAKLVDSTSEAHRMLAQKAIKIDGVRVEENVVVNNSEEHVYQVGKRKFAKIKIK